ncbi:MAG: T9SS type A sorting domain-containing protein [Bacteroidota bacterium]|nr:T9SS type A sorting domain-containing protein [Bacteroidota bacterium]
MSGFSWQLFNATCGGAISSGTLASLTFSSLVVGNNYVFCYTFTVPSTCTHSQHCPYFVGASVLPINLISFDAQYIDKKMKLNWETASEINNDFFTVEKSLNGTDFNYVTTVKGAGNSNSFLTYETFDPNPHFGFAYYRLKQTDFDGKYEYSELVAVTIKNNKESFTVYPNPAGNNAEISFNSYGNDEAVLSITNSTGGLVLYKTINTHKGTNTIKLDMMDFSKGIYFVSLSNKYEVLKTKFIKE